MVASRMHSLTPLPSQVLRSIVRIFSLAFTGYPAWVPWTVKRQGIWCRVKIVSGNADPFLCIVAMKQAAGQVTSMV